MSGKYPGGIVTAGAPAGYSVYFDDASSELTIANNANLIPTTQNFWIEAFIYITVPSATNSVFSKYTSASVNFTLYVTSSNFLAFDYNGSTSTSSGALSANTWYHVAVVRSGTSTNQSALYVNGTRVLQFTMASDFSSVTSTARIGRYQTGGAYFGGYISNLRYGIGTTAPYNAITDATINVPTQLFAVANTQLLTCQSPTIIDNSINAFAITTVGTPVTSTFTPFTGYSATPPNPNTQSNTSGVWSVSEAEYWMAQNQWPMPYPRQSLRFNSADSARLTRTNSVTGNQKTMTFSFWMKRTKLGTNQQLFSTISGSGAVPRSGIGFTTSDTLDVSFNQTGSAWIDLITTQVFRDVSSWYHIVIAIDTTQATSSNRVKLYVNGSQVTAFGTAQYPALNADLPLNWSTYAQYLGSYTDGTQYVDLYMSDFTFVDGLALDSSYFGQTDSSTGAWIPQNYTGNYGTNGFKLTFQDNSNTTATTLGKDWSGLGNNWTPNNFSVSPGVGNDSLIDSPWNFGTDYGNGGEVRGNYCTMNPLNSSSNMTITNGNLSVTSGTTPVNFSAASTIAVSSDKWYAEVTVTTGSNATMIGICPQSKYSPSARFDTATGAVGYFSDGQKYLAGVNTAYGASYTTGDVIGIAIDMDAKTVTFYKNGTSQGVISSAMISDDYYFSIGDASSSSGVNLNFNFGQRPFAYKAPSGYKALCTTNLPTPAIGATSTTLANKNFDATLYTGTGATQSITNAGTFQPDLVWLKSRSNALDHKLTDVLRGVTKGLITDTNAAETTDTTGLTAFNSNGFTVGANATYNTSAATYVAWQWKAAGAGVSNTNGSITSTVSANTTNGFSVVTWTGNNTNGATVGHGLSSAPKLVIVKNRSVAIDWPTYHVSLTAGYTVWINLTSQQFSITANTNNGGVGSVSATTFTCTNGAVNGNAVNGSGNSMVAYCFAEVAGFSKFGSYTGNGSADGPFVYCGFRPRFIMFKRTDSTSDWNMIDTARDPSNVVNTYIYANSSAAEGTYAGYDILSNGFKLRNTGVNINASAGTYIYAAFAETPFNYSRAR